MALDLGVDILALGAQRQQLHQVDVVLQGAAVVRAVPLRPHQLDEGVEGAAVIVEQQHLLSCTHQLRDEGKTQDQNRHSISNAIHLYCQVSVQSHQVLCGACVLVLGSPPPPFNIF